MLPIKSWRITYADGSTFSSLDGTWAEAPAFGVQCIVYYHVDPYKTIQIEGNDSSIYTYMGEGSNEGIKMGLWMDDEGFYRIIKMAEEGEPPWQ
jgi:hypothetical protein